MNGLFSSPRTASSTHVWKHGRWRGRKRERREDQTSPEARTQVEELTSRILQHRNMWRGEWAKLKKKVFSLTETSFQNIKRWENDVRRVQTEEGNTCTFWVFLFYATLKLLFHQNERHYTTCCLIIQINYGLLLAPHCKMLMLLEQEVTIFGSTFCIACMSAMHRQRYLLFNAQ